MDEQDEFDKDFPKKLKQLRINRGWSQGQLGKKAGINLPVISKYERGIVCPPPKVMIRLANVFEVSLDYLMRSNPEKSITLIKNKELRQQVEEIDELPEKYQDALVMVLARSY